MIDPALNAVHQRLNTDLEFFCEHAPLLIKTKEGGALVPWVLNRAQRYMQMCAERQLKEKGWVRMLLLKGRQQGGSTWTNGRFYWKTSRNKGKSVFILSHEGNTTNKLFDMVKRFHDNVDPRIRPETGKENTRQLLFPSLGSDYAAGTAGNKDVGRGGTAQLFHGSEVAYWEYAYDIQNGALKSIGLLPGTEIILESTANGPIGFYYDKVQTAIAGQGEYQLCFVPWFWQEEYEREPAHDFTLTAEEEVFVATYFADKIFPFDSEPISKVKALRKMAWRRAEIIDLTKGTNNPASGSAQFRNIYPSNPIEAFLSSGTGLILPEALTAARASKITDESAPLIGGVDPASDGPNADRTVIALRRGRHLEDIIIYPKMKPMQLAGILIKLIKERGVDMFFVDRAHGEGAIDRCHELGFGAKVQGVYFGESAYNPEVYANKRSEMIIETAKWLNAGGVRIPDQNDVHADFACMPMDKQRSDNVRFVPPKEEIKKILGRSPDIYDATALTFAHPVARDIGESRIRKASDIKRKNGAPTRMTRGIRK